MTMIDENTAREVVRAYEEFGDRIQGFLYGDNHVIRDVWKPGPGQVLWKAPALEHPDEPFMEQCQVERMKLALEVGLTRKAENARDLADLLFTILRAQDVHLVMDAMGMAVTRVALAAQPVEGKTRGEILNGLADHIKAVAAKIDEPEETD